MEAAVHPLTGLLPDNLARVAMRNLDDGRWELAFEFDAGASRVRVLDSDAQDAQRVERILASEFGFNGYCARETARRLFEPFVFAADWAW
jgi:hypothetical protein